MGKRYYNVHCVKTMTIVVANDMIEAIGHAKFLGDPDEVLKIERGEYVEKADAELELKLFANIKQELDVDGVSYFHNYGFAKGSKSFYTDLARRVVAELRAIVFEVYSMDEYTYTCLSWDRFQYLPYFYTEDTYPFPLNKKGQSLNDGDKNYHTRVWEEFESLDWRK